MGEMADLLIEQMERGQSVVYDKIKKEKFVIANIDLMYSSNYDNERYIITGEYYEEDNLIQSECFDFESKDFIKKA
jgi:hypothetical protein